MVFARYYSTCTAVYAHFTWNGTLYVCTRYTYTVYSLKCYCLSLTHTHMYCYCRAMIVYIEYCPTRCVVYSRTCTLVLALLLPSTIKKMQPATRLKHTQAFTIDTGEYSKSIPDPLT